MPKKMKKTEGGLQIGGNVTITRGDFVGGDKNVKVDQGGIYVGGDVQGSNIVTGDHNQVGNQEAMADALFAEIARKIEARPNISSEDKEDLRANVAEIKTEAQKGQQADESFLMRRIRNIERIAPDIADVVLTTLSNPVAGFATIVKKVAARSQKSAKT